MVTERDEQVEEELGAAIVHLELHRATTLERGAAADDEGEIVSTKLGVCVGSVGVGIAGGRENSAALDATLCHDVVSIQTSRGWEKKYGMRM